jgi:hypothetical protein
VRGLPLPPGGYAWPVATRPSDTTERPLAAYAGLLGAYTGLVGGMAAVVRRRRVPLPERWSTGDLALLSVATFRLSRLVTKDSVTAVVRAPFARYEEPAGEGEVNETVEAHGVGHAVGELLTCPFCVSVWVATAMTFGLVVAPRATRLVSGTLSAVAGSDALQLAFAAARRQVS